jgi:hypothetical protein
MPVLFPFPPEFTPPSTSPWIITSHLIFVHASNPLILRPQQRSKSSRNTSSVTFMCEISASAIRRSPEKTLLGRPRGRPGANPSFPPPTTSTSLPPAAATGARRRAKPVRCRRRRSSLAPVREEVGAGQLSLAAASSSDEPALPCPVGRRAAAVEVPRDVGGGARRHWRLRDGSVADLLHGVFAGDWARPGRRAPPELEVARTGTADWQATAEGGAGLHGAGLASAQI